MNKEEYTRVVITLFGREYPVKCTEEESIKLKQAEKALIQQLNSYRIKYAQLDDQDCLSMALIENELKLLGIGESERKLEIISKLDRLDELLSSALQ